MKKGKLFFAAAAATVGIAAYKNYQKKVNTRYSRDDEFPTGDAPETVVPGCLILEGGSLRSFYTAGVLDVLMQEGINLQTTIGVSAGSMMGCAYVAGQIGRCVKFNARNRYNFHYIGLGAEIENKSPFNFDFAFDDDNFEVPLNRERFFRKDRRYLAVATDCVNGSPLYFDRDECEDIFQAIRASSSLPVFSAMVPVEGYSCLDGGIADPIPIQWALDQGFEKIVVVRTRTRDFRKKPKGNTIVNSYRYQNYPKLQEALATQADRYNKTCDFLERLETEGRICVIAPEKTVTVSRIERDLEKLGDFYFEGVEETKEQLTKIKDYLEINVK